MADVVTEAWNFADKSLFPRAAEVDMNGRLDPAALGELRSLGLFGVCIPRTHGGLGCTGSEVRSVYEALASGCGSTYFVWMQHQTLARKLSMSANESLRQAWLPRLASGDAIAGDINYLRRNPPAIVARQDGEGYRLDGEAPWVAAWGIADVWVIAAVDVHADRVRYFVVPGAEAGLEPVRQLEPLAMRASSCWSIRLNGVMVCADALIEELGQAHWRARDLVRTAGAAPAVFGLIERALDLLGQSAGRIGNEVAGSVAGKLRAEYLACRERSYRLEDLAPDEADQHREERLQLRAQSHALATRVCAALIISTGGAAVDARHPAQRLYREAAFHSIQAQSQQVRTASVLAYG
jgi:alkylation response protein AidB-like acyl-CoA dehydrogenase